jgi:predicted lipase
MVDKLFQSCLESDWLTFGNNTQVRFSDLDNNLIVSFQGSVEKSDWKYNFDFPAIPYKDMKDKWHVHRGFLKAWKLAQDEFIIELNKRLLEKEYMSIIVCGYSHGGPLAILASEDIRFRKYKIECKCVIFGSPRLVWGRASKEVKERLHCYSIKNNGDIVTMIPFKFLGYKDDEPFNITLGRNRFPSHFPHYQNEYIKNIESSQDLIDVLGIINAP